MRRSSLFAVLACVLALAFILGCEGDDAVIDEPVIEEPIAEEPTSREPIVDIKTPRGSVEVNEGESGIQVDVDRVDVDREE